MTESEWNECTNAIEILEFALARQVVGSDTSRHRMGYRMNSGSVDRDSDFETRLHRFYVACCRTIWTLLPDEETRKGIEVAEKWLEGDATDAELNRCDYHVEGAAFGIDYKTNPKELDRWISDVDAIPVERLESMIHPPARVDQINAYELLKRAAYFAHFAVMYPAMNPKGSPPQSYHLFLSPQLLRQHLPYAA